MADIGHEMTDDIIDELEKRLAKEYKQATKELEEKLQAFLDKFAADDEKQRKLLQAGEITEKEYADWRFRHIMMNKRWEDMRNTLAEDFHNVNQIAAGICRRERPQVYSLNHNYAIYQVETDAGINTGLTLYNREAVERIMTQNPQMLPPPGKKVSKRIADGKDVLWNNRQIQSVMVQGILQGDSIYELARRLETVTEHNWSAAKRNARTMMTGAQNAGREDAYDRMRDKGIEIEEIWLATLDNATRHSHRLMHGKKRDENGFFDNGCRYPGDPNGPPGEIWNCRCSMRAWPKGYAHVPTQGPNMGGMTFEEWQEANSRTGSRQRRERRERVAEIGEPVPKPTENPEVVQWLKPIVGAHGRADDCRAANPNYGNGPEWGNNCQRVVTTYEARRRGYDVTALPCYDVATDSVAFDVKIPYDRGDRRLEPLWYVDGITLSQVKSYTEEQCLAAIERLMNEYGNGSRAIISGFWSSGKGGHVFIAENIDGTIHYIDPQNDNMNCSDYFDRMKPAAMSIFRVDDLPFNDRIGEVFRNYVE